MQWHYSYCENTTLIGYLTRYNPFCSINLVARRPKTKMLDFRTRKQKMVFNLKLYSQLLLAHLKSFTFRQTFLCL